MRERERNVLLKRAIGFFDSDAFFASLGLLFLSPFILGNFLSLVIYDSILEICDLMTREAVICFPFRKGCYGHLCIYGHIITHELITFWISFNFLFCSWDCLLLFYQFLEISSTTGI